MLVNLNRASESQRNQMMTTYDHTLNGPFSRFHTDYDFIYKKCIHFPTKKLF